MTGTAAREEPQKSKAWVWLAVIGPVLTIIGIIIGSQKAGSLCGSVFRPDSLAAELYDTMGGYGGASDCRRSIASAAVPTWILIVLGIVLVLTAIVVKTIGNNRGVAVPTATPGAAAQIEDLTRLKDKGLITQAEYEAKRAEMLRRL